MRLGASGTVPIAAWAVGLSRGCTRTLVVDNDVPEPLERRESVGAVAQGESVRCKRQGVRRRTRLQIVLHEVGRSGPGHVQVVHLRRTFKVSLWLAVCLI